MPETPRPRWPIPVLAALSAALLAALWFAIRRLAATDQVPPTLKIAGFAAASISCLLLALAWFYPILRRHLKNRQLGSLRILIGIYLIPLLVLALPLRLTALFLPSANILEGLVSWLRPSQPWLLALQGSLLAVALIPLAREKFSLSRSQPPRWMLAALAGTGLWLVSAFLFSLSLRVSGQAWIPQPLPAPGLLAFIVVSALFILPLTEEIFFRKMLPESLRSISSHPGWRGWRGWSGWRDRPILIWLACAAVFALAQARPVFFLPAFLFSLGLSALAHYTGRLRECFLAHAVFNLIALLGHWAAIL